jgi:hypothetical protein
MYLLASVADAQHSIRKEGSQQKTLPHRRLAMEVDAAAHVFQEGPVPPGHARKEYAARAVGKKHGINGQRAKEGQAVPTIKDEASKVRIQTKEAPSEVAAVDRQHVVHPASHSKTQFSAPGSLAHISERNGDNSSWREAMTITYLAPVVVAAVVIVSLAVYSCVSLITTAGDSSQPQQSTPGQRISREGHQRQTYTDRKQLVAPSGASSHAHPKNVPVDLGGTQ